MWRLFKFKSKIILGLGTVVTISIIIIQYLRRRKRFHKIMKIIDTISVRMSYFAMYMVLNSGKGYFSTQHRNSPCMISLMIEEFKKPSVHMKDSQLVEEMVCRLIRGGKNRLQVIADFDYTLSRFHRNGMQCETCHGALGNSNLLPKAYQEESQLLYDRYHPIELDFSMSREDKAPIMLEWWNKSHDVFCKFPLKKEDIQEVVRTSKVFLRDGADHFFQILDKHNVPVLVLSAGLGDLVTEAINQQGSLSKNVTVISNFMTFDEKGVSTGFRLPVIHTYNKNQETIKQGGYFEKFPNRTHIILLGDSLGDLTMADGINNLDLVLKIGFLNEKAEEALPKYLEGYDIVLRDDQTLDLVNGLLRKIP